MENRIYTKAQKESAWKQKGLLRVPKSVRQGKLALAAQEFIEGLKCYQEVRRMLAVGKRPRDVAILIQQQHKDPPILTFNTLKKYAQVYKLFFIPPLEVLRARVDNPSDGENGIVRSKLQGLFGRVQEVETLEKALMVQSDRINDQVKKEKELGLPLPGIDRAMVVLKDMIKVLVEMKMQLGYPGYRVVPVQVNVGGRINVSRIDALSPEDRHELIEIGRTISELMQKAWTKESFESPPEQSLPQ